jgi:hypothetical protein
MDSPFPNNQIVQQSEAVSVDKASSSQIPSDSLPVIEKVSTVHLVKNIYPIARQIILVTCIIFSICLIIFLMQQNGKSIYDNGI